VKLFFLIELSLISFFFGYLVGGLVAFGLVRRANRKTPAALTLAEQRQFNDLRRRLLARTLDAMRKTGSYNAPEEQ
jgi:hypothetical protein